MSATLWGIFSTANMLGFVLIFFIIAILNRQLNNIGVSFNGWVAYLALIPYFIVDKFAPFKWALVTGVLGGVILGFVGAMFLGGDEGGE